MTYGNCGDCEMWKGGSFDPDSGDMIGQCRLHPPMFVMGLKQGAWPLTGHYDGCGQHVPSAAEGEVEALRAISQQLESDIKEYASDLQSIEARATKAEAENTRLREAGNKLAAQSRSYSRGMSGSPDLGTALNAWDAVSRQARDQGDVG